MKRPFTPSGHLARRRASRFCPRVCFGGSCATSSVGLMGGGFALQVFGALAVIAAALLDPLQAAIGVTGLVGIVLVDAGVHPGLASGFLGIFWINGSGEYSRPGRCGGRSGGRRCGVRSALGFAEIVPLLATERAGSLGGLIFRTAFLRGQGLR